MSNYLDYLKRISNTKTFSRKTDYVKYNFGKYLKFKNLSNIKVLEIGPGIGEVIAYLNTNKIYDVDIIDIDKDILNNINKKYKVEKLFNTQNIESLDNELAMYDAIILTQVLEHIVPEKYELILNTLFKHLKKDGHIIITVPNMANPFTLCERYADMTHKNGFTDNSLMELAYKCNLSNAKIKIKEFNIPPYSLINIVRIILQKMLHLFIFLLSIINGGSYSKILTPNITLVIKK